MYINHRLTQHPQYLYDQDNDFDSTYADFFFSFPPEYAEDLKGLSEQQGEPYRPSQQWQDLFAAISKENKHAN